MIAFSQILSSLPFFVIFILAAVLALARWEKHPTVSLLVITAAGLEIFARVAALAMPSLLAGLNADSSTVMYAIWGVTGLISNAGLACLVGAAFAERNKRNDLPGSAFR